jgi:sulfate adenylyltransferase subunit 2
MSTLTHLQRLEAESIDIMREAVSESEKPVMLYSIGKDSSVILHLAMKAFYPSKPPFPLLHVVMLVYLYPFRLTPPKLVATDIAHAVPLTLIAGLGHLSLGNVDFTLLGTCQ